MSGANCLFISFECHLKHPLYLKWTRIMKILNCRGQIYYYSGQAKQRENIKNLQFIKSPETKRSKEISDQRSSRYFCTSTAENRRITISRTVTIRYPCNYGVLTCDYKVTLADENFSFIGIFWLAGTVRKLEIRQNQSKSLRITLVRWRIA